MEVNNNTLVNQNYKVEESKDRMRLSTEDFLKIMAAELKYQNASGDGSGSNTDYMSQLSQYTMLDKITELAESINQINMFNQVSLIGKEVTINTEEERIVGTVEKVKFRNQDVMLQVNGQDYPLSLLNEVSKATDETKEVEGYEL